MKKFILLAFVLISMVSLANAEIRYEKVKNEGTSIADWSGTYLIVREANEVVANVFNGGLDEDGIDAKTGNAILNIAIDTLSNGAKYIAHTAQLEAAEFTIAALEDYEGYYSILSASGLYIGHKDTADNGLSVETEVKAKCRNTIAFESATASKVIMKAYSKTGTNNFAVRFDEDKNRFRYFGWDAAESEYKKKAVWLYKRVEISPTAISINSHQMKSAKILRGGKLIITRGNEQFDILGCRL